MRKTKKELVDMLIDLENRSEKRQDDIKARESRMEEVAKDNSRLHETLEELENRHQKLEKEKKEKEGAFEMLVRENEKLKDRLDHALSLLESCETHMRDGYELFKSFVDTNSRNLLLIDATYEVRYINPAACQALGIGDPESVYGVRIFNLLEYNDALRLKEKIDQAFIKGGDQKVKDLAFSRLSKNPKLFKVKIERVRYEDSPSIKLILK